MFRFLLKKSNIFYLIFVISVFVGWLLLVEKIIFNNAIAFVFIVLAFILNVFTLQNLIVIRRNFWVLLLFLLLFISFYKPLIDVLVAFSYFILSFTLLIFLLYDGIRYYFLSGFLLSFSIITVNSAIAFVPFFMLTAFLFADTKVKIYRFVFGVFLGFLAIVQVLYLIEKPAYFYNLDWEIPCFQYQSYLLIPIIIVLLISVIDLLLKSSVQAIEKRGINRMISLLTLASLVAVLLFTSIFPHHLYYFALPFTVMISRYLQYEKNKWMVEISMAVIVLSLVLYSSNEFFHQFL